MKVMFVGGLPSQVGSLVEFRSFGKVAELDRKEAMNAARGGCVILPADDPAARVFTAEELEKRASFGSHASAPAEFAEKVRQARTAAARFAEEMEAEFQASLQPAAAGEVTSDE
jgi:hypothetical protein